MPPTAPFSALGEVMQLAFVPDDFDAALRFWTQVMGVGPFYRLSNLAIPGMRYRGQPTDAVFSVSIAYWGDMQIELIEQYNDAPSVYRERHDAGRGLHHVCIVVDDIDHARASAGAAGMTIVQEADFPGGGFFYAETGAGPGAPLIEVIQPSQATLDAFETMRAASCGWDGFDPMRER